MSDIVLRPLETPAERHACVDLQEATWGDGFTDRVPTSILMIAQETGGVASGAFHDDRLVGFVFGISGIRDDRRVHWSDMLAVLPEYRDRGIGYRLKLHQRELLLRNDIEVVVWTFDPLVARNAYLNLRRLGAISRTYKRDLYGRSGSPLHSGIGTDRLLAEWWIASDAVTQCLAGERPPPPPEGPLHVLNPPADPGDAADAAGAADRVRPGHAVEAPVGDMAGIVVPADIHGLKSEAPGLAQAWRENVRAAFELAFDAGYQAVDAVRNGRFTRYVLQQGSTPGPWSEAS